MARTLRVIDWDKHFETSETRKWKQLRWVPVSNNLADPGYLTLVVRENGAAMLGAWLAILQLASRCKVRGVLQEGNGTPYTIDTIALVVRMPVALVRQTVELLTTQVKWLEWFGEPSGRSPEQSSAVAGETAGCIESNGTERNFDRVDSFNPQRIAKSASSSEGARDAQKISAIVRPRTNADRELVAKVCWIKQCGPLSENAVWDAVEGVDKVDGVRNRMGYFRTCLGNKAKDAGLDLSDILRDTQPTADFREACWRRPAPRMMEQ